MTMPVTANQKQSDLDDKAQHDTLLKQYEIQWQDHFQTRSQTWKGLEISVILAVALVGLDWKIDHRGKKDKKKRNGTISD